jgi:hypothetical protein
VACWSIMETIESPWFSSYPLSSPWPFPAPLSPQSPSTISIVHEGHITYAKLHWKNWYFSACSLFSVHFKTCFNLKRRIGQNSVSHKNIVRTFINIVMYSQHNNNKKYNEKGFLEAFFY